MHFTTLLQFAAAALLVDAAAVRLAARDNRDEVIVLGNCKSHAEVKHNKFAVASYWKEYEQVNKLWPEAYGQIDQFPKYPGSDDEANIGDWQSGTSANPLTSTLSKGHTLKFWGLEKGTKVGEATGFAEFDGVDFRCYREDPEKTTPTGLIYDGPNDEFLPWYDCSRQYSCTRDDRSIRESTITISEESLYVSFTKSSSNEDFDDVSPEDAFANVLKAAEGNHCKNIDYEIGNSCSLHFTCVFGRPNDTEDDRKFASEALGKLISKTAGEQVAGTKHEYTTYSNQWGVPKYHRRYEYPKSGQLVVMTMPQDDPGAAALQASILFEVTCETDPLCSSIGCDIFANSMVMAADKYGLNPVSVFGTLVGGLCGACG